MARAKVKLNIAGLREVLKSEGTQAVLDARGQAVASRARGSAPVDSGAYRESIEVETRVHRVVAATRVTATAPHALLVEARTGNLARAL